MRMSIGVQRATPPQLSSPAATERRCWKQRHLTGVLCILVTLLLTSPAHAWHDLTHMAVVKAAGLDDYTYLAVGADMAKEKSGGREEGNHYRDNEKGTVVTAEMVLGQVREYNCRCDGKGQLYGAIIAALDEYLERKNVNKYARYPFGYAAHYIGDLSMPLHNTVYDDFNKANHAANDGVVEQGETGSTQERVARIARHIQQKMKSVPEYRLPLAREGMGHFNLAVAKKVAEIANRAMALGFSMRDATPPRPLMTREEAYRQLAESAVLLKAVFAALQ
ncbi:MAG TPA: hypothetical protein VJ550_09965 [Geomonas sp.]|nr:hypothetical protein [Geomonas sp.]